LEEYGGLEYKKYKNWLNTVKNIGKPRRLGRGNAPLLDPPVGKKKFKQVPIILATSNFEV